MPMNSLWEQKKKKKKRIALPCFDPLKPNIITYQVYIILYIYIDAHYLDPPPSTS